MSRPLAETPDGLVAGEERGAVRVFRGIPFAAPPLGELRFAAPRPPQPWRGTRDASRSAAPGLQQRSVFRGGGVVGSEDCLYLDVYAPAEPGPHPVLVWIHGGGAVVGAVADCDGTALAEQGVVVVAIAYRLGALGMLHLPGVFAGEEADGNFALLDQIAALRWVARSVAAFGGDPARVTVGGLSNGGRTAGTLLATPAARGLFRQAAIMSGTGVGQLVADLDGGQWTTTAVLRELGLEPATARRLRDVPAVDLLAAQERAAAASGEPIPFQVVVDGMLLPRRPLDALAEGAARDVPLLIGTAHDEYDAFAMEPDAGPLAAARSALVEPERLARAQAAYRRLLPEWSEDELRRHVLTAADWWLPAIRFAEAAEHAGGRAWMYRLDWRLAPRGQGFGAPHALDLPVLSPGDVEYEQVTLAAARRDPAALAPVLDALREALARFVREGDPGGADWPAYEPARRATRLFDDRCTTVEDPDGELRRAWDWSTG